MPTARQMRTCCGRDLPGASVRRPLLIFLILLLIVLVLIYVHARLEREVGRGRGRAHRAAVGVVRRGGAIRLLAEVQRRAVIAAVALPLARCLALHKIAISKA